MEIKMRTTLATLAFALLFAATANAAIIHETDYEAEPTTGFGVMPSSMLFADAGGDLIGFSAVANPLTTGDAVGVIGANPNSGSFHYAVDAGATTAAGNGWGASWSGQNSLGGSGGFTDEATAIANGAGCYIDLVGATFTVSAMVATDAADPLTGAFALAHVRLEFGGTDISGNPILDVIPRVISPNVVASTITPGYQLLTTSYTLTAADVAAGVTSVFGVMGTEGSGDGAADGMVYFDDYLFEVSDANVVVVGDGHAAIPEPSTASLILAGLMGLCGVRRRKS